MADRLKQIGNHLGGGNFPNGMLPGEVAIITGAVHFEHLFLMDSFNLWGADDDSPGFHALVGAAQGIGKAAAILFAKEGAKVVVSDLDEGAS